MGFFKDFKDDFSQAVNELMPGEDNLETEGTEEELVVNTLESEVDVKSELSKLDGLLEQVSKQETVKAKASASASPKEAASNAAKAGGPTSGMTASSMTASSMTASSMTLENPEGTRQTSHTANNTIQEERKMADNTVTPAAPTAAAPITAAPVAAQEKLVVTDEVSVITEGTVIKGDIISNGSLDVRGQINGDVSCNGKLTVTGVVNGNSNTSEFFADSAQVEGEVVSTGTVKIGLGSVIIGNVSSTSAVIAGAIKGDIDVQGPVVVDTSAVVMGNIKSRSVQINNGAVIEGFCSQCYSDVDVASLFDGKKGI